MDSNYGDIKLTKGLVEIETLQWFVKLDWNSALETSQLFMMKMRGNPVLVVSHLVPYLKRWNIWKSTRICLLTNFFMMLKMMQFSNQLLKCLIHCTIFFWCCFLAHLELQWLGWIHGRMRRQPKKSRSTAIPHHGVHIVTRPTLRRDLKINFWSLILFKQKPALQRCVFSRNQRFLTESLPVSMEGLDAPGRETNSLQSWKGPELSPFNDLIYQRRTWLVGWLVGWLV